MSNVQITSQKKAGKILANVIDEIIHTVKEGQTTAQIDRKIEQLITKKGGYPGFKKVPGYKYASCISVNDAVVHGIPNKIPLKNGDVLNIDSGVYLNGFHTDITETIVVGGKTSTKIQKFLDIGYHTMFEAISMAKVGKNVGHISNTIQSNVEKAGYSVVRGLIGHGVGKSLHEDPEIPGYLEKKISDTSKIADNMVLAVEVIYTMGKKEVFVEEDDWTIKTHDGSISAVFERTILVNDSNLPILLTPLKKDIKMKGKFVEF